MGHKSDNDNSGTASPRLNAAIEFRRDGDELLGQIPGQRDISRMPRDVAHQTWVNLGRALEEEFHIPLPYDSELLTELAKEANLGLGSLLSLAGSADHIPLNQISALFQLIHRASYG